MTHEPILYVEDEEDYQILVRRILQRAGLEVATADTGEAGLAWLAQRRPSLLILDINLPDTDGYAICRQLRADPAWERLPILMLTVRRRPEEWLRGFSSGANDYISKPLNPPELVERVVACLEGKSERLDGQNDAELQLIHAAAGGNRPAFEVLLEKYRGRLVENIRQMVKSDAEADDVLAQTLLRAYERLADFRGEASFFTWLYRIAMNEAGERNRRAAGLSVEQLAESGDTVMPEVLVQPEGVSERLAEEESQRRVREVLAAVPRPYRQMLEMFFLKDLTYDDIARRLNIPTGTVMSRLYKARTLLKEAWDARRTPAAP